MQSSLWQSVQRLWCRHPRTIITSKTESMPAHRVCEACGWREPVQASMPHGTRTWDSSRDEARYTQEKLRREAFEEQRQRIVALRTTPTPRPSRAGRARELTVVANLKQLAG
jgi:hypothetical protein